MAARLFSSLPRGFTAFIGSATLATAGIATQVRHGQKIAWTIELMAFSNADGIYKLAYMCNQLHTCDSVV